MVFYLHLISFCSRFRILLYKCRKFDRRGNKPTSSSRPIHILWIGVGLLLILSSRFPTTYSNEIGFRHHAFCILRTPPRCGRHNIRLYENCHRHFRAIGLGQDFGLAPGGPHPAFRKNSGRRRLGRIVPDTGRKRPMRFAANRPLQGAHDRLHHFRGSGRERNPAPMAGALHRVGMRNHHRHLPHFGTNRRQRSPGSRTARCRIDFHDDLPRHDRRMSVQQPRPQQNICRKCHPPYRQSDSINTTL